MTVMRSPIMLSGILSVGALSDFSRTTAEDRNSELVIDPLWFGTMEEYKTTKAETEYAVQLEISEKLAAAEDAMFRSTLRRTADHMHPFKKHKSRRRKGHGKRRQ